LPWFGGDLNRARSDLTAALEKHKGKDLIALADALDLIRSAQSYKSLEARLPLNQSLTNEDDSRRYIIDREILIETRDGAHIAAEMVRPKSVKTPQPALLIFTIYVGDSGPSHNRVTARVDSVDRRCRTLHDASPAAGRNCLIFRIFQLLIATHPLVMSRDSFIAAFSHQRGKK
jgi:hypothetical protein